MVLRVPGAEWSYAVQNKAVQAVLHQRPAHQAEHRERNALGPQGRWGGNRQRGGETCAGGAQHDEIEPVCGLTVLKREQGCATLRAKEARHPVEAPPDPMPAL